MIRWRDLPAQEAMELGLDQAGRFVWQALEVEVFGYGCTIMARVKPMAASHG